MWGCKVCCMQSMTMAHRLLLYCGSALPEQACASCFAMPTLSWLRITCAAIAIACQEVTAGARCGAQDKNNPGHAIAIHATAMVPLVSPEPVRFIAPPAPCAAVPLAAPAALPLAPPAALRAAARAPALCEPNSALDAHTIIHNLQVRTAPMLCAALSHRHKAISAV